MRRRCRDDTNEMLAEYAQTKYRVKLNEPASTGHHVMAKYELRAGAVKTRSADQGGVPNAAAALRCPCGGVAKRRGLDGAEHSATLIDVMDGRCVWLSKRGQKFVR